MGFPDTSLIIIGFTIVFLLVGTVVINKIFSKLPFAKIYFRLRSHYKDSCSIFTVPPPTYEKYGEINKIYKNGRTNAIICEYFLFLVVVVFIFLISISYLLSNDILGALLGDTIGVIINPMLDKETIFIISDTPFEGVIFFIMAPQLIINPYFDYLLMKVLFNSNKIPPLFDDKKFNELTNYIDNERIWTNFIYGTPCLIIFYVSAKIILFTIFGTAVILEHEIYITSGCLAFSITFMAACRSITLSEMFSRLIISNKNKTK